MPYPRKLPSGKWQVTVKHPSGRRYTKTDPLKKVVMEWGHQIELDIRRGEFVDPKAGRMTLSAWWAEWEPTRIVQRATATKRESVWRVHVQPAFGAWPIASIQSWDVERWVADMVHREVGLETVTSAFRLLQQLLRAGVRHRLLRASPCELVEVPRPPKHIDRILDLDEADRLLAAVTTVDRSHSVKAGERYPRLSDPVNRLFVRLMLEAGLRWQEAAGLHVFRVDLMRRVLRVQEVAERGRRLKPIPKSSAGQRVVPLTDDLVEALSIHLAGVPREGLVFPGPDGRPFDYPNWLKRVWAPAVEAAGLTAPLPTPHDCRHSYGSWLAEQGVPPHEIAALMGHGSLRAVERYLHASEARLERARGALGARRAHAGSGTEERPRLPGGGNGA